MDNAMDNYVLQYEITNALKMYLEERNVSVNTYQPGNAYVVAKRPRAYFQIVATNDGMFNIEVEHQNMSVLSFDIEIAHPNSLQQVYELIMSKRWR